jgi:hypothetical protein
MVLWGLSGENMNKKKVLLVSLIAVLSTLGLLFIFLWPKPPHMTVTFYSGSQAAPQTVAQFQYPSWVSLTLTIQGASPNTLFTWALYERTLGTYQWIFVEGTGSVNTISPDSTDGNGYCSWTIGLIAATNYDMPSSPSPVDGWPLGQYEIKVTVTSPAPVTSNSVSEDSNIVVVTVGMPSA